MKWGEGEKGEGEEGGMRRGKGGKEECVECIVKAVVHIVQVRDCDQNKC